MLPELLALLAFEIWAIIHVARRTGWHEDERGADAFVALIDRWRREDLISKYVREGNPRAARLMVTLPVRHIRRLHRHTVGEEQYREHLRHLIRERASKVIR